MSLWVDKAILAFRGTQPIKGVGIHIDNAFKANNHTRYVNDDDPVTKLPPELIFSYNHHGTPIHIADKDGETDFIYDHSIVYYSENIS